MNKSKLTDIKRNQVIMEKGDRFGIGKYSLHPIWLDFIAYCRKLGYGELRNLKIKDGLPMVADEVIHKVNFSKYEGYKK